MIVSISSSGQGHLFGRFLLVSISCRAESQIPKWFWESMKSLWTLDLTRTPSIMTLHCSDSPHQWTSQTTLDRCVWQLVTVCSTTAPLVGSPAGEMWRKKVRFVWLVMYLLCIYFKCLGSLPRVVCMKSSISTLWKTCIQWTSSNLGV